LATTTAINKSLNTLRDYASQSNNERLFTFDKNGSGGTYATPEKANSGSDAKPTIKVSTYGVAHIHQKGPANNPSGLYEMFSLADLRTVYFIAKGYAGSGITAAPMHFNMLVLEDYTYAVFPNNPDFKTLDYIFEDKDKYDRLDEKLRNKYIAVGSYNQASHTTLAQEFLKFINNVDNEPNGVNLNVSLYRIDNSNAHYGNWEKLELDPNNNNNLKDPIPCN
jgi:hypothetical protein